MHVDLNALETLPTAMEPSAVCVVGAGIAGLVLARRLAERGIVVTLLEAGGLDLEPESQALYEAAEMGADQHTGTLAGRFRTLGGSSTRWGGQLLPYTDDIFQPPPEVPSAPWPIREAELQPYYTAAEQLMGVDALPYTAELLPAVGRPAVTVPPELRLRFSKWAPFHRRNLAQTVGRELLQHPGVRLYTHANAAELLPDNDGRVRGVRAVDYRGRTAEFPAEAVVVATGTVESSRLLLLSPSAVPDPHRQVGTGFHDHVSLRAGVYEGSARSAVLERLGPAFMEGTLHTAKLEASTELRAREQLLATMAHFVIEEPEDSGVAAVRNLLRSVQRGRLSSALREHAVPVLRGIPDAVQLLWAAKVQRRRAVSARAGIYLHLDLEQPAGPERWIGLSEQADALGLRKAVVHWRVGDAERQAAERFRHALGAAMRTAGLPGPRWTMTEPPVFTDTYHPMGGLRMSVDAAEGVVDPDLRVHGLKNLYVASCAVFPAGGSSNPTFTLMALALRLGDAL